MKDLKGESKLGTVHQTCSRESTKHGPCTPGPWAHSVDHAYGPHFMGTGLINRLPQVLLPHKTNTNVLMCLIAASSIPVNLPALSFVSNMADGDESKHYSLYYDSFDFSFRFSGKYSFSFWGAVR